MFLFVNQFTFQVLAVSDAAAPEWNERSVCLAPEAVRMMAAEP